MPTRYAEIASSLPEHLAEFLGIPVAEVLARMPVAKEERSRIWIESDPKTEAERDRLYASLGELDLFKYAAWHRTDTEKQIIHDKAVTVACAGNDPVLDVGGGIGDTTLVFAVNGVSVTYIDFPGKCLDFARLRWQKFGCSDRVRVLTPTELWQLGKESFGVVMSTDVLEHLENPVRHAVHYYTLLRPGGHLFVLAHFRHSRRNPDHLPENDAYHRIFGGEPKTARRSVLKNLGFKRKHWYHFLKP